MNEVWKTVPETKGYYQVSSFGRVRRMGGTPYCKKTRLLSGWTDKTKYPKVWIAVDGKKIPTSIHSLVALAFLGPRPDGYDVNHKNGVRDDNRVENLEYCSRTGNILHSLYVLRNIDRYGRGHLCAKLSVSDVKEIRLLCDRDDTTHAMIAERFNVSITTISNIFTRKAWAWIA